MDPFDAVEYIPDWLIDWFVAIRVSYDELALRIEWRNPFNRYKLLVNIQWDDRTHD